jgi:putative two-component system response regulator
MRLAHAVESRDGETGRHVWRMSSLCERVALALGLTAAEAEAMRHASALHDLGKIGIPDAILHKPGKLDADEWRLMQEHADRGGELLAGSPSALVQLAETIARTHHERWDGNGYPRGLAAEQIPLPGRIAAVCDVFDALLAERPYKPPWSFEDAVAEIERQAGTQFDPRVVRAFLGVVLERETRAELGLEQGAAAAAIPAR